jgi:RsiW-degrading membrane proteinase PrsW (M82 family)
MSSVDVTYAGKTVTAQPGSTVVLGRSPDSDVVVPDPSVSRRHATLEFDGDRWVLHNHGQAGTYQAGRRVDRIVVSQRQEVRLAAPDGPAVVLTPETPAAGSTAPDRPGTTGRQAAVPRARPATDIPARTVGEDAVRAGSPASLDLRGMVDTVLPIRQWMQNPGWRQWTRLLVIPYGLLPLVYYQLLGSNTSTTAPGWAYSIYVAPLWLLGFYYLIRPPRIGRYELWIAAGIAAWVPVCIKVATTPIDNRLAPHLSNPLAALGVGINEELTKALPIAIAAFLLLRLRGTRLDVRTWMLAGTFSGLVFGVLEAVLYVNNNSGVINTRSGPLVVTSVYQFADRIFADGFDHAMWAAISAFFIGLAVKYGRRRWQLIGFGLLIAAVLHGANDWTDSYFHNLWPQILVQLVSVTLFSAYMMSAQSIERAVRRSPQFRGRSLLLDEPSSVSSEMPTPR